MTTRATKTRQRADQEGLTGKTPLVGLCCGMLLWAGVASAGYCRPIEYAELKDMKTKDLIKTYCAYGKMADAYSDMLKGSVDVVRQGGSMALTHEATAGVTECLQQRHRIRTILDNRSLPDEPVCPAPTK